jgi:hypothetical protein
MTRTHLTLQTDAVRTFGVRLARLERLNLPNVSGETINPVVRRRNYLLSAAKLNALLLCGSLVSAVSCVIAALSTMDVVNKCLSAGAAQNGTAIDGSTVVLGMLAVSTAVVAIHTTRHVARTAPKLPYVPVVREQIACLPAKEILVRGASEPTAVPSELLRAVSATKRAGPDQLLRPDIETSPVLRCEQARSLK